MAEGLRRFAARPSWRPAARIFTGQDLRDASGQRPCLTWDVTVRGSLNGRPKAGDQPSEVTLKGGSVNPAFRRNPLSSRSRTARPFSVLAGIIGPIRPSHASARVRWEEQLIDDHRNAGVLAQRRGGDVGDGIAELEPAGESGVGNHSSGPGFGTEAEVFEAAA